MNFIWLLWNVGKGTDTLQSPLKYEYINQQSGKGTYMYDDKDSLGNSGCTMMCVTMGLKAFGVNFDQFTFNDYLKSPSCNEDDGSLGYTTTSKLKQESILPWMEKVLDTQYQQSLLTVQTLKEHVVKEQVVLIKMRYICNKEQSKIDSGNYHSHWVLARGYTNSGTILVNDPGSRQCTNNSVKDAKKKTIYRYTFQDVLRILAYRKRPKEISRPNIMIVDKKISIGFPFPFYSPCAVIPSHIYLKYFVQYAINLRKNADGLTICLSDCVFKTAQDAHQCGFKCGTSQSITCIPDCTNNGIRAYKACAIQCYEKYDFCLYYCKLLQYPLLSQQECRTRCLPQEFINALIPPRTLTLAQASDSPHSNSCNSASNSQRNLSEITSGHDTKVYATDKGFRIEIDNPEKKPIKQLNITLDQRLVLYNNLEDKLEWQFSNIIQIDRSRMWLPGVIVCAILLGVDIVFTLTGKMSFAVNRFQFLSFMIVSRYCFQSFVDQFRSFQIINLNFPVVNLEVIIDQSDIVGQPTVEYLLTPSNNIIFNAGFQIIVGYSFFLLLTTLSCFYHQHRTRLVAVFFLRLIMFPSLYFSYLQFRQAINGFDNPLEIGGFLVAILVALTHLWMTFFGQSFFDQTKPEPEPEQAEPQPFPECKPEQESGKKKNIRPQEITINFNNDHEPEPVPKPYFRNNEMLYEGLRRTAISVAVFLLSQFEVYVFYAISGVVVLFIILRCCLLDDERSRMGGSIGELLVCAGLLLLSQEILGTYTIYGIYGIYGGMGVACLNTVYCFFRT